MVEPTPLDGRSRALLDGFRQRTEAPFEASRVEPVWRKAKARVSARRRLQRATLAVVAVLAAGLGVAALRGERETSVVADAGARWQRGGNTVTVPNGRVWVGATG
ncbi:MAG: hypothetical protein JNK82_32395, partial [Myxococcaceae bacterium]|nr:hypothetical protein [Myxococcaceae bacterium]